MMDIGRSQDFIKDRPNVNINSCDTKQKSLAIQYTILQHLSYLRYEGKSRIRRLSL